MTKKSEGDKKANYKAICKKDYSRQKEHQVERPWGKNTGVFRGVSVAGSDSKGQQYESQESYGLIDPTFSVIPRT